MTPRSPRPVPTCSPRRDVSIRAFLCSGSPQVSSEEVGEEGMQAETPDATQARAQGCLPTPHCAGQTEPSVPRALGWEAAP